MDSLPLEIIHIIALTDIKVYHALITACPRYARSIPPVPRIGHVDRFDMMIHFGFNMYIDKMLFNTTAIVWYRNGRTHMNVGPAAIYAEGNLVWRKHGKLHRDGDLPAIIHADGSRYVWYREGKLHRDGDKPALISEYKIEYYANGKLHRDGNKPAIIQVCGNSAYYVNGELHRDDGPACTRIDGVCEWWNRGTFIRDNRGDDI